MGNSGQFYHKPSATRRVAKGAAFMGLGAGAVKAAQSAPGRGARTLFSTAAHVGASVRARGLPVSRAAAIGSSLGGIKGGIAHAGGMAGYATRAARQSTVGRMAVRGGRSLLMKGAQLAAQFLK